MQNSDTLLKELVYYIYGDADGEKAIDGLMKIIDARLPHLRKPSGIPPGELPLSQEDAFIITYGDQFFDDQNEPLDWLNSFAGEFLSGVVSGVHILPFFPYTSDDGFSISDYMSVNPSFGGWSQVSSLGNKFRLMADLVLNHCSKSHQWFSAFLEGTEPYDKYFITMDPKEDLSEIVRPRALPLLTPFETNEGTKHVWTTFSDDQVDLNFWNYRVLLEMVDIFFHYIEMGVQVVRLDAIAYLWKELGHPSIHHPKTHGVVKVFRRILELYAPWVVIITETNVPHEENISYFGRGNDEAQMIYQFSLPPLTLDAFNREDVGHLTTWAKNLPESENPVTYFNFLASHDGVGLTPAHGILSEKDLETLIGSVQQREGLISYKATASGKIPYEMNVNYLSAVAEKELPVPQRARKFLASQAVLLSMIGVPGIYIHSLIGSENDLEGVKNTGRNRSINREKLNYSRVVEELKTPGTLRYEVYQGYRRMLVTRREETSFSPLGAMRILETEPRVFTVLRIAPGGREAVICIINVSSSSTAIELVPQEIFDDPAVRFSVINTFDGILLMNGGVSFPNSDGNVSVTMDSHAVVWLKLT